MTPLEMLQVELSGTQYADNTALLEQKVQLATDLCKSVLYPFSEQTPPDVLPDRYNSWIFRACMELISKMGAEGETEHSENGVTRYYGAGTLSPQLLQELTPIAKVVTPS